MANIENIKDVHKIVTQKDLERAERKYNTEHYEEEIWEDAVDETNRYIDASEIKIEGLENIVTGLEAKKFLLVKDVAKIDNEEAMLEETYDKISQKPEIDWTKEERSFMKNYEENKEQIEFKKNIMNFSLEEMNNIIKKRKNEVDSQKNTKKLLETHRDGRVKPRYEKEKVDAQKANDEWEELKEIAKAQGGAVADY